MACTLVLRSSNQYKVPDASDGPPVTVMVLLALEIGETVPDASNVAPGLLLPALSFQIRQVKVPVGVPISVSNKKVSWVRTPVVTWKLCAAHNSTLPTVCPIPSLAVPEVATIVV